MKKSMISILVIIVLGGISLFCQGANSKGVAQVQETYSILGRVTDKEGNGLYGVTITLTEYVFQNKVFLPFVYVGNSDQNNALIDTGEKLIYSEGEFVAVTDENGYYSFTDLSEEAYSVKPIGNDFLPSQRIVPAGSNNANNQDFSLKFDISEDMVYVAEGEFWMGCDPEHNDRITCPSIELPLHIVHLDAYMIDKTEVTNVEYAKCVAAGDCYSPGSNASWTRSSYFDNPLYEGYPVVVVTWNNASNYCSWLGKRLPTEAEWEKAARGKSPIAYPWGDISPTCELANGQINYHKCISDTNKVGSYPLGVSPYGVSDLAGNVWEWVYDWWSDTYYSSMTSFINPTGPETGVEKIIRGGCFDTSSSLRTSTRRKGGIPETTDYHYGFRCVDPIN